MAVRQLPGSRRQDRRAARIAGGVAGGFAGRRRGRRPWASVGRDLKVITRWLSFPELDALLSRCAVFVGNDTGPKHMAALRGAPVVSIHMGAVPWQEWGQDGSGFIVTRRAPCYGCGIEDVADCGKGLPCLVDGFIVTRRGHATAAASRTLPTAAKGLSCLVLALRRCGYLGHAALTVLEQAGAHPWNVGFFVR